MKEAIVIQNDSHCASIILEVKHKLNSTISSFAPIHSSAYFNPNMEAIFSLKRRLTFNALFGVIFQKTTFFITPL
jgi:hypothetical protein